MSKQKELEDIEIPEEDSIDLIVIAKNIWSGRKTIYLSLGIAFTLGVVVAFLSPKEYSVSSIVVPQYSGKTTSGGLSSLAAMAGIDMGSLNQSSDLSPLVYPEILGSAQFQLDLMNIPFHFAHVDHPVSMLDYYTNYAKPSIISIIQKYTIGLPGVIIGALRPKKEKVTEPAGSQIHVISLTDDQTKVANRIVKMISLETDSKNGYLTLTTKTNEPLLTAEIAQATIDLMQKYITQFKIQKSQDNLSFIQDRYNKAKSEMESAQLNAAVSTDKNKYLTSSVASLALSRQQTKFSIANAVFLDLAKQLEQAKIDVKRDTPVFTIIQPVVIPNEPTSGKMMKIVIFLFLGGFIGVFIVLGKVVISQFKERWNEN